ncbi:histidine kinase [Filimonas effusa]|nr:histidine kinase [Filimonas effusa]
MSAAIYRTRYFIATAMLLFLCFSAIGLFVSVQFGKRTRQISIDMATKVYQLKSDVIRNEFKGFLKGLNDLEPVRQQINSRQDFIQNIPLIEAILLSHPGVTNGWYALTNNKDTLFHTISKQGRDRESFPLTAYRRNWTNIFPLPSATLTPPAASPSALTGPAATPPTANPLTPNQPPVIHSNLVTHNDSTHWMLTTTSRLPDASTLVIGLDINLIQLQHYLWSVDTTGRAYAFITSPDGIYITHPDEKLVGKKMPENEKPTAAAKRLGDSVSQYETVISSFLQIPVVRYYTPMNIAGMQWNLVVDTPVLAVVEDVNEIEKYLLLFFMFTAGIVLFFIAWAQTRWQKEFTLRQQAELQQQQLLVKTQSLSIEAERQQKHNALLQLNTLKEKMNPHFLFNSLSSLHALIEQSPELAQSFVMKLSNVYRYVLNDYSGGLTSVEHEMELANEYFFLLKIRFGNALAPLEMDIAAQHRSQQLPFMSLQSLIENAVKHNVLSKENPLHIRIYSEGPYIVVANTLKLRHDVQDSGKQGLNYLRSIYQHFGGLPFLHGVEENTYKCLLPVIPRSQRPTQ